MGYRIDRLSMQKELLKYPVKPLAKTITKRIINVLGGGASFSKNHSCGDTARLILREAWEQSEWYSYGDKHESSICFSIL